MDSKRMFENFKADMAKIGVEVTKPPFSNFYSFDGTVRDWELFLKSLGYDNKALVAHASKNWRFRVSHTGYYKYGDPTTFSCDFVSPDNWDIDEFIDLFSPYPKDDLRSRAWVIALQQFNVDKLKEEFIKAFKAHIHTFGLGDNHEH